MHLAPVKETIHSEHGQVADMVVMRMSDQYGLHCELGGERQPRSHAPRVDGDAFVYQEAHQARGARFRVVSAKKSDLHNTPLK